MRRAFATRDASLASERSGAPSNFSTRFALGLLVVTLTVLAIVPSAGAFTTRLKTAAFGPDGTALSTFFSAGELAFDQAGNRLYVLDRSEFGSPTNTLHAFNAPALTLPGPFPLTVSNGGFPSDVFPIAVDNTLGGSASNVYYVSGSQSPAEIYGFKPDGTELNAGSGFPNFPFDISPPRFLCGAAVDSAGNVWFGDLSAEAIRKYDSSGNALSAIDTFAQASNLCRVAFDSNDDMFVGSGALSENGGGVWRYTAASGYTTATRITSVPIQAIAVDTTADRLYVVQQDGGATKEVAAYDTGGAFLYNFATGIANESLTSVAVDQGTDQVYVSDQGAGNAPHGANDKVYVFGPAQDFPNATGAPTAAKNITDASAELGATITDNGVLPTNWRLELSADAGATWKTVASGQTAGGQTNAAVSGTASGLQPNFDYKFRLITNKGAGAESEVVSFPLSFKTAAPPPVLSDVGVVGTGDTSVRVAGTIDPRNTATGYVFQYGSTPALGSSTAPVSIGGGLEPITVSQVLAGLSPNTTYYFRLVATNLSGTTVSSSHTVATRATPLPLPDDRGYEMVSPPDKNLGSVDRPLIYQVAKAGVSRDGQSVAFCTGPIFSDTPPQLGHFCTPYISQRGADGWRTRGLIPPFCVRSDVEGSTLTYLSPNFDHAVLRKTETPGCAVPPLDPAATLPAENLYRQDLLANPFTYDLLTPLGSGIPGDGSDDFGHFAYVSASNQTDPLDSDKFARLYDWHNGSLSLVSRDPSNQPFTTPSNLASVRTDVDDFYPGNAVSASGDRIYFQNEEANVFGAGGCQTPACDLYMRENNTTTHHVSASECTVACGVDNSADAFLWASVSGDKALFISCAKLTDASSPATSCPGPVYSGNATAGKLYRWDETAPPGHRLVDLSVDHEPADGNQPDVRSIVGASEDGDTVFFLADRQIVPGQFSNFDSLATKLYRWSWNGGSPSVEYLASLSTSTAADSDERNWNQKRSRVTPDGKYLVINSGASLDPVVDRDADRDIYRWDEQDGWLCISCQQPGVPSAGNATQSDFSAPAESSLVFEQTIGSFDLPPVISDDGQRVFFDTPDALVPEDVNGEASCSLAEYPAYVRTCADVYEWHDGAVDLISSGIGNQPSYLIGFTRTGSDVTFFTRQRLVGWDVDNGTDLYDARIGGGFPEPPPAPVTCEGEGCRGPVPVAPPSTGAGTAAFQGPGNPTPKHQKPRKTRKKSKHAKKHAKRHQRAANHNRRAGR